MEAVVTESRGGNEDFMEKFSMKNINKLNHDNSDLGGAPGKRSTLDFFQGMAPTATS